MLPLCLALISVAITSSTCGLEIFLHPRIALGKIGIRFSFFSTTFMIGYSFFSSFSLLLMQRVRPAVTTLVDPAFRHTKSIVYRSIRSAFLFWLHTRIYYIIYTYVHLFTMIMMLYHI